MTRTTAAQAASIRVRQANAKTNLAVRLWKHVRRSGEHECWHWTGAIINSGYGVINVLHRNVLVHRASWKLANGPIPEGMQVMHRCDNKTCINPAHLTIGSCADNLIDMARKERNNKKISGDDVRWIREWAKEGWPTRLLAAAVGISWSHADNILKSKRRQYVEST